MTVGVGVAVGPGQGSSRELPAELTRCFPSLSIRFFSFITNLGCLFVYFLVGIGVGNGAFIHI